MIAVGLAMLFSAIANFPHRPAMQPAAESQIAFDSWKRCASLVSVHKSPPPLPITDIAQLATLSCGKERQHLVQILVATGATPPTAEGMVIEAEKMISRYVAIELIGIRARPAR